MRASLLLALCLIGCPKKVVPDHLRLDSPADTDATNTAPRDLPALVASLVARDPLVRAPAFPDIALQEIDGANPVIAFIAAVRALEGGEGEVPLVMAQLEREHPGTLAVPLSRGYRLRVIENDLANLRRAAEDDAQESELAALITGLRNEPAADGLPRSPMAWLAAPEQLPDTVRRYGDRWALTGWLASPAFPLSPVASALQAPQYGALAESPTGKLLLARASGASADPSAGLDTLERATTLALTRVSADRDSEQRAWAELRRKTTAELGDQGEPELLLLASARDQLTAAAKADAAAGGALISIAALRLYQGCTDLPCTGLDRVETLTAAKRYGDQPAKLSALWRVIATKQALDDLEAGRETVRFPLALIDMLDALHGAGAGPIPAHLLRKRSADEVVWLALSRAAGGESVDWVGARVAIGKHLAALCDASLALEADPHRISLIERIRARAVP